jgi:hypothetical protein
MDKQTNNTYSPYRDTKEKRQRTLVQKRKGRGKQVEQEEKTSGAEV